MAFLRNNKGISEHLIGLALFAILLIWFYRIPPWMWHDHLPSYGDPLEALWQIDFWRTVVLTQNFEPLHVSAAYPVGIHQLTVAHAGISLFLLPLSILFGSAVALNIGFLLSFIVSFFGSFLFVKSFSSLNIVSYSAACIFTFALGRTVHIYGHLNILWASALGTWMGVLFLRLRHQPSVKLATVAGILWAMSIVSQPYMLFMGAILLTIMRIGVGMIKYIFIIFLTTFLLSTPFILSLYQAINFMNSLPPTIDKIIYYNADISSYVGWGPLSYWEPLRQLTKTLIQRDARLDPNVQTWGVLTIVLAVWGAIVLFKVVRTNYALLVVLLISALLSLGPLWVNPPFAFTPLSQVGRSLWQLGVHLKPSVFNSDSEALMSDGWPLPAILPLALVPYFELARIPRRYAIWVGLIAVTLSALALSRLPRKAAVLICCLWIIELLPQPIRPRLIPTQPHPAHSWAARELAGSNSGIHISDRMVGVYSQHLAGRLPGTGFIGSFTPAHMRYLLPWRGFTEQALIQPEQAAILRRAQVAIVFMNPERAELAKQNPALRFLQCFDPGPASHYYPKTLCAFKVLPRDDDFFNIQPVKGFSDFGQSVVHIEDSPAKAGWRISQVVTHSLELDLQANCLPLGAQSVIVKVNSQPLASHTWRDASDQHWRTTLVLESRWLTAGWNSVELVAELGPQLDSQKALNCNQAISVRRLRVISTN